MLEIKIFIVIFFLLPKQLIMKSLIPQKAQLENEFYTLFKIHSTILCYLLALRKLNQLLKLFMVEYKKYQHFID